MLKKIFSTIFAFIFIVSTIILTNTSYAANNDTTDQEIIELRGSNYKAYQLENKRIGYKFFATDVHYKDKDNKYVDIDTSIADVEDAEKIKSGFKYKNKANNWDVYFGSSRDNIMQIKKDKYTINTGFLKDNSTAAITPKKPADVGISKKIKDLTYNNTVIYQDILPFTHLVYTVGNTYVKENLVVEKYTGQLSYTFRISLDGLKLKEADNLLYLVDQDSNEPVFEIAPVYIEDSAGQVSYDGNFSYRYDKNDVVLTINIPEDFMTSPDTVYPVMIDPTFKGSSSSRDTFVACLCSSPASCTCTVTTCACNKNYNSSGMGDNFYKLRAGKDTAYGVRRTYIDFDNVYATVHGMQIYSASLNLYFASTDGGARNIRAYALSSWLSGSLSQSMTWKTKPGYYNGTVTDPGSIISGGSSISINVEGILQYWANSSVNNANGFLVRDDNEANTSVWSTFYSSDYSDTAKIPYLYVSTTARPTLNEVDVKLLYDTSFANCYNDATDARTFLDRAGYAFRQKWNINFFPTSIALLSGLPSDSCPNKHAKCSSSCNTRCWDDTSTPNHHKNAYRIYNITKTYPLNGNDIQVLLLCQFMCSNPTGNPNNWSSNHGGNWGLALGDYVNIPFDYYHTTNSIDTMTHEISHLFGCHNGGDEDGCISNQRCCMKNSFQEIPEYENPDIWCDNCEQDFNRLAQ